MVAVDPSFDALHLGGLGAVLAGGAVLYWLVALLLSRRAKHLSPALGTVLLGAIAVNAGYFLPWARVASRHFSLTLFGGDFGGAFGAGALSGIGVAIFLGAALSPVWESRVLRVGLGAVLVGAGVGAGLLAMQFLHPDQAQTIAAFSQQGPGALAESRHIPLAQANEVIDRLVASGVLRVSDSFGPYVVVAGAIVATAAAVLNFMHQVRVAVGGRADRRWSGPGAPEGGPLARSRSGAPRGVIQKATEKRKGSKRTRTKAPAPKPSPSPVMVSAHRVVVGDFPPAPPMPGGTAPAAARVPAQLDSRWAAGPASSSRLRRNRAR
jgi:hypothetical protein